jgi:hypothetical protein
MANDEDYVHLVNVTVLTACREHVQMGEVVV